MISTGHFTTQNASRYLQQLCKHFGHKIPVEYDETQGRADLAMGPAHMQAGADELTVTVTADDDEGLARARAVIDNHLVRFAFRENFEAMTWDAA